MDAEPASTGTPTPEAEAQAKTLMSPQQRDELKETLRLGFALLAQSPLAQALMKKYENR